MLDPICSNSKFETSSWTLQGVGRWPKTQLNQRYRVEGRQGEISADTQSIPMIPAAYVITCIGGTNRVLILASSPINQRAGY